MTVLRIALGQINTRVGDVRGNLRSIQAAIQAAGRSGVDLIVFPEQAVPGYPLEDLAFQPSVIQACGEAMKEIAGSLKRSRMIAVVGGVESEDELWNGAAVMFGGELLGWARKRHLLCCGRLDESRYFSAGERPLVIETEKFRAAVSIGEDFAYPVFPGEVELLINLWNEPYHHGHRPNREGMMLERAKEDAVAMALVNAVGGQDDLIFEGSSAVVDGFGEVLARGRAFAPDLVITDLDLRELKAHRARTFHSSHPEPHHLEKASRLAVDRPWPEVKKPRRLPTRLEPLLKGPHEVFAALALATRDFVEKNGFDQVIIGISGGIDSALVAAIAREALGPRKVTAVSMPGPYTSKPTRADAKKVAKNLGLKFLEIPIASAGQNLLKTLAPAFKRRPAGAAEENLQARLRGLVLMALANQFRGLVLTTGNKSEAAVGYCTLYGDTCGAFAPIKDVYKTQVYELALWFNRHMGKELIPQSVIERPPTAELKPGQRDQDTLPPYPDLDRALKGLLEKNESPAELVKKGEAPELIAQAQSMFLASEFKRKQSPLGPTISEAPLSDFRLPVTKTIEEGDT